MPSRSNKLENLIKRLVLISGKDHLNIHGKKMSDHYICFIPTIHDFIPSKESQKLAIEILKRHKLKVLEVTVDKNTTFRDCGENFESIHCPHCKSKIKIEYWSELMDKNYSDENGFSINPLLMPCCHNISTLNDLCYKFPMGFSRFILRTDDQVKVSDLLITELESAIKCKLRVIYKMC